jgi:hypothetical protein
MMRDGSGCSRVNWLLHLQSRSGHPHLVQVLPVSVEYTVRELRSVIGTDYQGAEPIIGSDPLTDDRVWLSTGDELRGRFYGD